jgi:hypothetical protein
MNAINCYGMQLKERTLKKNKVLGISPNREWIQPNRKAALISQTSKTS